MSRKIIIGAAGLALILALGFTINRFNNAPRLSETTDFLMDTVVTVKVYAPPSARAKETVANQAVTLYFLESFKTPDSLSISRFDVLRYTYP